MGSAPNCDCNGNRKMGIIATGGGVHTVMVTENKKILLPPANEVWSKVIFSQVSVIPSVYGGGDLLQGDHHRRVYIQRGWPDPPPASDTMGYSQRAGSMRPTGMHSCLICCCRHSVNKPLLP